MRRRWLFEVHFWIVMQAEIQARQVESEVRHAVARLLQQAGITIAFPQSDVHLHAEKPLEINVRQTADWVAELVRSRRAG